MAFVQGITLSVPTPKLKEFSEVNVRSAAERCFVRKMKIQAASEEMLSSPCSDMDSPLRKLKREHDLLQTSLGCKSRSRGRFFLVRAEEADADEYEKCLGHEHHIGDWRTGSHSRRFLVFAPGMLLYLIVKELRYHILETCKHAESAARFPYFREASHL